MPDPFAKPLRIGDPDQVRAMKAMNGEDLYCPKCYSVSFNGFEGQKCGECGHGQLVWGATSPNAGQFDVVHA